MMKKLTALVTALSLTATIGTASLAAPAVYGGSVTVNGNALDLTQLPAAAAVDAIPLRQVVEADYGFADWYQEDNRSYFTMDGVQIYVDCATGAVERNGEALKNVKAELKNGVTFVPASVLNGVEGYTVSSVDGKIALTTPNSDPMVMLARDIIDKLELASSMKQTPDEMEEYYGLQKSTFTELVGFFPMMISADTVIIGKVAPGQIAAAKAKQELEVYRAKTQQNFEQYLPGPLERAQNGQVVTSGDYIMLIISGDNDTAIQMFQDGVKNLK